jgi:hypothetical protein
MYNIILFNYRVNFNPAYIINYNYKSYSYIILIKSPGGELDHGLRKKC